MNQPAYQKYYNLYSSLQNQLNEGIVTVNLNVTNEKQLHQQSNNTIRVIYQPVQGIPEYQNPPMINLSVQSQDEQKNSYIHNVFCYVLAYLLLFIGCIGVQFGLYGSKTAASLWITSYLLLIITLLLFYIVKHRPSLRLLLLQAIIIGISFILEITAVSVAITHPVLFNYQSVAENAQYNNRRLEEYDYDTCAYYYNILSYYDYQINYGNHCDSVLGFSITGSSSEYEYCLVLQDKFSEQDYENYYSSYCDSILGKASPGQSDYYFCQAAYNSFSYSIFQQKYGIYCNPLLGLSSQDNQIYKDRYHYQSGNLCLSEGFYDIYKQYCYPLQYGMMVYAILNLVIYFFLFFILMKKIYKYFLKLIGHQNLALPVEQNQPLPQNIQ